MTEKTKKILFICHTVTIAHLIRALLVAREMKIRGHEVFFGITDLRYESLLKKEGIPVFKISAIDRDKAMDSVRNLSYNKSALKEQLQKDLDSDLELIGRIRPDIVVNDMRFTVKMACYLKKIPYAVILNAYYSGRLATRHKIPEAMFLSRVLPVSLQRALFPFLHKMVEYLLGSAMREVAYSRDIPGIKNISQTLVSDSLTLICDLPEFFPCRGLLPNFHYVGPFLWEPEIPVPEWFNRLDSERPTIYFTLGTSGEVEHLREILQILSAKGYQIIVSTGGIKYTQEIPKDVYFSDFLPALKIMDKISLVICHGGNGTIYQGLSKGVPVIGLPTFYDQEWNSERLEQLGLGKSISLRNFNRDKFIKATEGLISNEAVKKNCLKFKELISHYDAPKICADLIEGLIKNA